MVVRDRVSDANSLLLASVAPVTKSRMVRASRTLPGPVQTLANKVASRIENPLTGGTVYTDDRAPVEWLTDLSLVQYAAGNR